MNATVHLFAFSIVGLTWSALGGVAFIVVWLMAAVAWAVMSLMGSLMANDSGSVSADRHMKMLVWLVVGEILAAAAGIPGGLAFFWAAHRTHMLIGFAGLLVTGAAMQVWAVMSFFAAAGKK